MSGERELAAEAASCAVEALRRMLVSGKLRYSVNIDSFEITHNDLQHALACAMLAWEHRNMEIK